MALVTDSRRVAAPSPAAADGDARWRAIVARDASADGAFVYGVRTTGIYCRPSCPSRASRRNVVFFAAPADAAAAGLRPCRRCAPDVMSAAAREKP